MDALTTPVRIALATAVAVTLAVLGLRAAGGLERLELRAWDAQRAFGPVTRAGDRVAVVEIREADFERYGHPVPDAVLARALDALLGGGASAVGVDLYRDRAVEPGHAELARRVLDDARIVMVEKIPDATTPGVAPPRFLRDEAGARQVGFSDLVVDGDGAIRRALLFLWDEAGAAHPSLALQLALRHLARRDVALRTDPEDPETLQLGAARIRPLSGDRGAYVGTDTGGYQILLDRLVGQPVGPTVGFGDLVEGRVPPDFAEDRVVLVGTRAPSVRDDFMTASGLGSGVGVLAHASAVDQLLRMALDAAPPVRAPEAWATAAAVAAWALLGGLLGAALRSPWTIGGAIAAAIAATIGLALASASAWVWLPWVPTSLALALSAAAAVAFVSQRERAERTFIQQLFGRYLSSEVASHLRDHREEFLSGGRPRPQRLVETILMADIASSSEAAEKMDSQSFVEWIDTGLGLLARACEAHGGIVEYFSGDGLKVDFGVPIPRRNEAEIAEDARSAARAALEAAQGLKALNRRWRDRGWPPMRVRMGIHSGETVAGSVGSESRLQYTTLGAVANVASRLESHDKDAFRRDPEGLDCRILVSGATRAHLLGESGIAARIRSAGTAVLRGSDRALDVYELRSPSEHAGAPVDRAG